jgi:hypothetical protein
MASKARRSALRTEIRAVADYDDRKAEVPQKSGELDLIRDTIVKHRMHAENIKERLAELAARLFGEGQASANDGDSAPAVSMLARIRDEANELGTVLAGASDILDKLETL